MWNSPTFVCSLDIVATNWMRKGSSWHNLWKELDGREAEMLELPGRCYTSTPTFGANNHTLTYPPCMWKRLSRTQKGIFFRFIFRYVNLVVGGSEDSCWQGSGAARSFLLFPFGFVSPLWVHKRSGNSNSQQMNWYWRLVVPIRWLVSFIVYFVAVRT